MSSTPSRRLRFSLVIGLVLAFAGSTPLAASALGSATAASRIPAAGSPTTVLGHPRIWAPDVVHATAAWVHAAAPVEPAVKPAAAVTTPVAQATTTARPTATKPKYAGTNHLWIPSLGISHSVAAFACTRSTPPGAGVYRWGCAGHNNAYLFGHAWSTLKPLHDAYVAGRLHTGMVACYADGTGHVRAYKVTQIKVVTPDQTTWAIAAQAVPSMTLQTCVGANSQYRLLVRLVAIT